MIVSNRMSPKDRALEKHKEKVINQKKKDAEIEQKRKQTDDSKVSVKDSELKMKKTDKESPVASFWKKNFGKFQKATKIYKLPKNLLESIPFESMTTDAIIETYKGTFTRTYKFDDVNFKIAQDDEQIHIFKKYMDLLNAFNTSMKWQFTIFNHAMDKMETIRNIHIQAQKDGLNVYRNEMNEFLMKNLSSGNNSIKQEKYLTIAVENPNAEVAIKALRDMDSEINKRMKKMTKTETKPLTVAERMRLLYNIYNQDSFSSMNNDLDEAGKEIFNLGYIKKQGATIKDVIGPSSLEFKGNYFKVGNYYAKSFFLHKIPTRLSTDFIANLGEIQHPMLISVTNECMDHDEAVQMVKARLSDIEAQCVNIQKRNNNDGIFAEVPPELDNARESARELMSDITKRNQNIFFVSVAVTLFASNLNELKEGEDLIISTAKEHICTMKPLTNQQEFGFNTTLPLCRNDLFIDKLYTTESSAVFIPFNSKELNQKNSIFYGLNQTTRSMIMYNRLSGKNYNGLVFGSPGSGKSFTCKLEMVSVLLNRKDSQIFVIDPQGEYEPLCKGLHGEKIMLAPGSNVFINPLDLDLSADEDVDPITMKSDFVYSMMEIMLGQNRRLEPVHRTIIDRAVRKIYKPYMAYIESENEKGNNITIDTAMCPTLSDLYQELKYQNNYEADRLAEILEIYAVGSFNSFANRTNVQVRSKFVVYDIKKLGTGMRELGLHICTNDGWNRMIQNSKYDIYTWFYIDEFHILLESESTTLFLKRLWKMARKWLGVPTGIMQNTEDLLRDADTRAIVNTTSFVIMLEASLMDRNNLAELFNLSPAQVEYITEPDKGHGLIYNGKVVLPFGLKFPKNTKLYQMLSTSHDTENANRKEKVG